MTFVLSGKDTRKILVKVQETRDCEAKDEKLCGILSQIKMNKLNENEIFCVFNLNDLNFHLLRWNYLKITYQGAGSINAETLSLQNLFAIKKLDAVNLKPFFSLIHSLAFLCPVLGRIAIHRSGSTILR